MSFASDMVVDGIWKHNCIDALQGGETDGKADEIKTAAGAKKARLPRNQDEKAEEKNGFNTTNAIFTIDTLLTIIIPFDFTGKDKNSVATARWTL